MPSFYGFSGFLERRLSDILGDAYSEIISVVGEPIKRQRFIENRTREKAEEYRYYILDNVSFENDLDLCFDLGVVAYENEQCNGLIAAFDIRCYFRIPKQQQFEWPDIFSKHNNYFTEEANFYWDRERFSDPKMWEHRLISDDYIEIGLYRRISFEEELKAYLEELKAYFDGRSSRTPREIKQMFNDCFVIDDGCWDDCWEDSDYPLPFRFQFESILNEFLTCIKNHKSC